MDRRDFLKGTSGAAAAAATVAAAAAPALAQETAPAILSGARELRLATPWAEGIAGLADQAHSLARRIETASGGRYRITAGGSGSGSALDAVRRGDAELYFASEEDHLETHRALAYFGGLPGEHGLPAHDLEAWMLVGGGQMLWDDLAAEFGVKGFLAGHTGAEPPVLLKRPVAGLDDLRGQRIFTRGLARDVVAGLGAQAAPIADAEVTAAFAGGDLLAAAWGGAVASHAIGLHRHAARFVAGGLARHGAALSLGMDRTLWDGLDTADQEMFRAAAAAEFHLSLAQERAHASVLAGMAARGQGPAAAAWPDDIATAVSRVSSAVIAHVARSDAHAGRISASYGAFAAALGSHLAEWPAA